MLEARDDLMQIIKTPDEFSVLIGWVHQKQNIQGKARSTEIPVTISFREGVACRESA
jgi:hypothetical protein